MSLVGWWKFDGDISDSSGNGNDSDGSPSFVDGKIGQAIEGDGSTITVPLSNSLEKAFTGNQMTLSIWWKQDSHTDSERWRDIVRFTDSSGGTKRLERGPANSTSNADYWCNLGAGVNGNELRDSDIGVSSGEWFNLVVRRDGNNFQIWVNGELKNEETRSNGMDIDSDLSMNIQNSGSQIDEVRIYDHALSKKKIKELSKAKVLHYKFDNFAEYTENLLPKSLREMSGTSGWQNQYHSSYSYQFVSNVDGREHVYELTHDGNADDDWYSRYDNLPSTSVGEEYVFSREYKVTKGSDKPNNPRLYQDGWKNGGTADRELLFDKPIGNGWRRIAHKFTITTAGDPVLRMSTGYTSNEWKVFMDNFQFEKKDHATPFVNGTRDDKVVDSSGYGNHASLDSSAPKWREDSKIGSGAYAFDGNDDRIVVPHSPSLDVTGDEITVAYWQKFKDAGDQDHPTVVKNAGSDWEASNGGYAIGHGWSDNLYSGLAGNRLGGQDAGIREDGSWHFIVHTYKNGEGMEVYRNGNLEINDASFSGQIKSTAHDLWIGDAERGGAYYGSLDDIRIYATALSKSEVEELYKQRVSIDGRGNMHSHEFSEDIDKGLELHIESAGNDSPTSGYSELVVNGNEIGATGRGINALEIDRRGNKINTGNFDIYGSSTAETDNLVQFIENAQSGHILMFAEDDHAGRIESNGVSKLQSLGSEHIVDVSNGGRSNWAFICKKGAGKIVYGETFAPSGDGPVYLNHTLPDDLNIRNTGTTETELNEVGPGASSLVGYWPLGGDTRDYSGNGNHGTNNGATVTSGLRQSAYSFDGSSDYISTEGPLEGSVTAKFTLNAWIKPKAGIGSGIIIKTGGGDTDSFFRYEENSEAVTLNVTDSPNSNQRTYSTPSNSVPTDNWNHVAATIDEANDKIELYVNGEKMKEVTDSDAIREWSDNTWFIGKRGTIDSPYFDGKIQDIRVFDRALTSEEIKLLCNLTDPRQKQKVIQSSNGEVYTKGEFDETL